MYICFATGICNFLFSFCSCSSFCFCSVSVTTERERVADTYCSGSLLQSCLHLCDRSSSTLPTADISLVLSTIHEFLHWNEIIEVQEVLRRVKWCLKITAALVLMPTLLLPALEPLTTKMGPTTINLRQWKLLEMLLLHWGLREEGLLFGTTSHILMSPSMSYADTATTRYVMHMFRHVDCA